MGKDDVVMEDSKVVEENKHEHDRLKDTTKAWTTEDKHNKRKAEGAQLTKEETKRLRRERKVAKPFGAEVLDAERLFSAGSGLKQMDKAERTKLVQKVINSIKGNVPLVVARREGSKVVQHCLKHGTMEQASKLAEELVPQLINLAKNMYAVKALVKIWKYCSHKVQKSCMKKLTGHWRGLYMNQTSVTLVDVVFQLHTNEAQKLLILQEFYHQLFEQMPELSNDGKALSLKEILVRDPLKKDTMFSRVSTFLWKMVEKETLTLGLVHRLMCVYLDVLEAGGKEEARCIDALCENPLQWCQTKDGCKAVAHAASYSSAKQRKNLVKQFKGHVHEMALDEDAFLVLARILDVTDDTQLTGKQILAVLFGEEHFETIIESPFAHKLLLSVLRPRHTRLFTQQQRAALPEPVTTADSDKRQTSKKSAKDRRTQLLKFIIPGLSAYCVENCPSMMRDRQTSNLFIQTCRAVFEAGTDEQKQALTDAIVDQASEEETAEEQPVWAHKDGHFALKQLVIESASLGYTAFLAALHEAIGKRHHKWCLTRGAFVILALLEQTADADIAKQVRKTLKKKLDKLKSESGAGCKLVVKNVQSSS